MPYYTGDAYGFRGDYYRGDYYRGDPGLFSFVGKALGGVAKLGTSIVRSGLGLQSPVSIPSFTQPTAPIYQQPSYGLVNIGQPGPSTGLINIGGGGGGGPMLPSLRGYRLNKSTYVTRGGGTSRWPKSLQLHAKLTVQVKSRRMNVGNARALRRSLRRVAGFAKLVKRSKRAISRAASAVGVRRGVGRRKGAGPSVRIVKAA
jgi:hypothetical protein